MKNTVSSDFLKVLQALKSNIMRDLNVADICQVTRISNDSYTCKSITDNSTIYAVKFQDLEIKEKDIVCVLFINTEFQANLKRLQLKQALNTGTTENLHTKNSAIIIGLVYRENTEDEGDDK